MNTSTIPDYTAVSAVFESAKELMKKIRDVPEFRSGDFHVSINHFNSNGATSLVIELPMVTGSAYNSSIVMRYQILPDRVESSQSTSDATETNQSTHNPEPCPGCGRDPFMTGPCPEGYDCLQEQVTETESESAPEPYLQTR